MPTGYTYGIIEGKTKDFESFAKQCSRSFLVHLRDESMDSEYKEREPSGYHVDELNKAKKELKDIALLTDNEIVLREKTNLLESKKYHIESNKSQADSKIKLESFLVKARLYKPPTDKHYGISNFMIEQLEKTIEADCNRSYHTDELKEIDIKLRKINADVVRSETIAKATKDIAYHTKEQNEDLKRCEDSNKWYDDFINSLK